MIKSTTQKLLVWLYPADEQTPRMVLKGELADLFPELTPAGWNSLLLQAHHNGYVVTEKYEPGDYVRLTELGAEVVRELFPAFSHYWRTWTGRWGSLWCLTPPKADPNFRSSRQFLLKSGIKPALRGVYLYPWPFPEKVLSWCRRKYGMAVAIAEVSNWTVSDLRAIVAKIYGVSDLIELYSGVSSEMNALLVRKSNKKGSDYQSKVDVYQIFNRYLQIIAVDPGFLAVIFSQDRSGLKILSQLQKM